MRKLLIFITLIFVISCAKTYEFSPKISAATGDLKINGKEAFVGSAISVGDRIKTGDKSFCDIMINDKSIIRIQGKSSLVFKISATDNTLEIESGWLSGITRKVFTKEGSYRIKSPTTVASVRGTSFCTKVEDQNKTYFCVCNGTITLEGSGQKETVASAHHTARRFVKDKDGNISVDSNPGLLYHDDGGLEKLASAIGEKIDWNNIDKK